MTLQSHPDLQCQCLSSMFCLRYVLRAAADAMKFNGPAPELINGRLAMIGILAAAKQEIDTGATVLQQALQASPWLYAVLGLWVYASLVPILKGVRHEAFGELLASISSSSGCFVACRCSMQCAAVLCWGCGCMRRWCLS
jgi:hypothetical protein